MHEHNNRNRAKWIVPNLIKQCKTEIVHLSSPSERKETFGQPYRSSTLQHEISAFELIYLINLQIVTPNLQR